MVLKLRKRFNSLVSRFKKQVEHRRRSLDILSNHALGKIILSNMYAAAKLNHIDKRIVNSLIDLYARQCKDNTSGDEAYDLLLRILIESFRNFSFSRQGPGVIPVNITTIISYDRMSIGEYAIVDESKIDNESLGTFLERVDDELCSEIAANFRTYLRPNIQIGALWNIFWASFVDDRTIAVETAWRRFNPGRPVATRLRDWLGLVEYRHRIPLFQFSIHAQNAQAAAPTFIEGFNHRRFKAMCDGNEQAGWGTAADLLKTPEPSIRDVDGGREIVVRALATEAIRDCRWLGKVDRDPDPRDTDATFSDRLVNKHGWDVIVAELSSEFR